MKNKKPFCRLLILIILTGCKGTERNVELYMYNLKDPYVNVFSRQICDFSSDLYPLKTYDAQNSQILQNEQIENMIKNNGDLMIINPVDRLGVYPVIKRARQENIPIIFFNREPLLKDLELWDRVYYVGARAEQSGQIQAQMIMELFGNNPDKLNRFDRNNDGRIQAVILKGEQGHQDAEIRTAEVVKAFREKGFRLEILITEVADWNINQAYDKMGQILKDFKNEMEVILSNNDAMALGAIKRMRENGVFVDTNGNGRIDKNDYTWLPVVGIDGIEDAVDNIELGYLYGTVLNDSVTQAKAIVDLSECVLGMKDISELEYKLEDGKYIWVDYRVFTLD